MTKNNNEVMVNNVNEETGEILPSEQVVHETQDYKVVKLDDGTFKKNMKYKEYSSRVAETEDEKIKLYKLFNNLNSSLVTQFKNMIDIEIIVKYVYSLPYESFDESTGIVNDGVTTTIEHTAGSFYAPSFKSVYNIIFSIMQTFGYPDDEN